ncbi:MAG: Rpn family recombination-promoting nuclease/putative transposase [Synergistaceae bacterium]|jgi:predicted transposase/invertase (TIGR01784 family)|nr:Rpn family recombination-promoting nuclease/putative transposase [Synergistaceae bacterium]
MERLEYTFKNDTLFKMLFVKNPDLLKRLVAQLLDIRYENIEQFVITNPEMPPEALGDKFCRLDINMIVDGQRVDLEIQVRDERDFPERTMFHWAREYSTALGEGETYIELPRVIIVSIVSFKLFDCAEYRSEFQALEVTRHTRLTDRMALIFFELPKLPKEMSADDESRLWLKLFNAETEEDLRQIEALGVPIMNQAIGAYRSITATEEFRTLERMRADARHNEAAALHNARNEGRREESEKWQKVVEKKDAALADKDAEIARLRELLGDGEDK